MSEPNLHSTILLEIDAASWERSLDRAASWFGNVLLTQVAFRRLAEDAQEKLQEPHLVDYLGNVVGRAREHEAAAGELHRMIGREPSALRSAGGAVLGKVREGLAQVLGWAGGAVSPWREVHELLVANTESMGAFAIAEQLGLALALPEVARLAFDVVTEKATDGLLLQEYVLELAPTAILHDEAAWRQGGEAGQ